MDIEELRRFESNLEKRVWNFVPMTIATTTVGAGGLMLGKYLDNKSVTYTGVGLLCATVVYAAFYLRARKYSAIIREGINEYHRRGEMTEENITSINMDEIEF